MKRYLFAALAAVFLLSATATAQGPAPTITADAGAWLQGGMGGATIEGIAFSEHTVKVTFWLEDGSSDSYSLPNISLGASGSEYITISIPEDAVDCEVEITSGWSGWGYIGFFEFIEEGP